MLTLHNGHAMSMRRYECASSGTDLLVCSNQANIAMQDLLRDIAYWHHCLQKQQGFDAALFTACK